jgi:hypothetical protein
MSLHLHLHFRSPLSIKCIQILPQSHDHLCLHLTNSNEPQASGNLGPSILKALLADGSFNVTVLTRESSTATFPENVKVIKANYESLESLKSALKNQDALISTLASLAVASQLLLIDAAIASGVTRFLPSEFGSDIANPRTRGLPVFAAKVQVEEYLKVQVAQHPSFSYTLLRNSAFLDWGLQVGFLFRAPNPLLSDGGHNKASLTTLATIGKGVVGVLHHLDETANRAVYIQDLAISEAEILDIAKKIRPDIDWKPQVVDTAEAEKEAWARLKDGKLDDATWVPFLRRSIWAEGYGGHFQKLDNELLGIEAKGPELVEELLRPILAKI